MPNSSSLTRKKEKKSKDKSIVNRKKKFYKKGEKVQYNSREGFFISYVTIVDIHHDDINPYYTILSCDDKKEIQTESSRLSEIPCLSPNKLNIIKKYPHL